MNKILMLMALLLSVVACQGHVGVNEVTPAGSIAAGETCAVEVFRLAATTDTYAQLFDVTGITINYSKQLAN